MEGGNLLKKGKWNIMLSKDKGKVKWTGGWGQCKGDEKTDTKVF